MGWVLLVLSLGGACSSSEEGSSGGGTGGAPGVHCAGGKDCDPGDSCCVSLISSTPSDCAASCQTGSPFACDGPEDCGGNACCGDLVSGVACAQTPDCPTSVPRHCHRDSDCPEGERCLSITYDTVPANTCTKN